MNATATLDHAVSKALVEVLGADPSLVVLAEGDHPQHGRLASAGLADRVEKVPVADRGVLAMALGLAIGGRAVLVEIAVASRLRAAVEVLAEAAAMPRELLGRPLVVRVPWGAEAGALDGPVLGELAAIDGLRVQCGATPGAAAHLLREALARPGVTILLEPRSLGRGVASDTVDPARVRPVRSGRHVLLAASGADLAVAERAAEALSNEGIEAAVVDLVSLHPVDGAGLGGLIQQAGRLVVLCPPGEAAWGRWVCQAAMDAAFLYFEAPPAVARPEIGDVVAAARAAVAY